MAWIYTEHDAKSGCLWRTDEADKSKRGTVGLDLDWTLIKPRSGRKHPLNHDDWEFLFPGTPEKIQALSKTQHVVIFSNQTKSVKTAEDRAGLMGKLDAVVKLLGVPASVFISCGYGPYRKPKPRMWEYWLEVSGVSRHADDVYVGDAAGRPKKGMRAKDFADTDHTFARNAGVRFTLPEEIFLGLEGDAVVVPEPHAPWAGVPNAPTVPSMEWNCVPNPDDPPPFAEWNTPPSPPPLAEWKTVGDGKELVVMVGAPGAGKSAYVRKTLGEYSRISQDELGNRDRCLRAVRDALAQNKKVVVDNTNPSVEVRALYIDLARQALAVVRCVHITTPRKLAEHLNVMREDHPADGVRKPRVPPVGETMYWSKFVEPEMEEGFTEVHRVKFEYSEAETPSALFRRWHR